MNISHCYDCGILYETSVYEWDAYDKASGLPVLEVEWDGEDYKRYNTCKVCGGRIFKEPK